MGHEDASKKPKPGSLQLWLLCLVCAIAGLGIGWLIFGRSENASPLPDDFYYVACEGFDDSRLPEELLGRIDDDQTSPRAWMIAREDAAEAAIGAGCKKLWILTEPYESAQKFVLYFSAGTGDPVSVSAYLLKPSAAQQTTTVTGTLPAANSAIHTFNIPPCETNCRLLIFVAMTEETYLHILHDPRFRIASQPIVP